MSILNWVVNEHVFGEEDLGNRKITSTEASTGPDLDCRKADGAALLRLKSPLLKRAALTWPHAEP